MEIAHFGEVNFWNDNTKSITMYENEKPILYKADLIECWNVYF